MKQGLWHLLTDLLSAIVFLIAYAVSGDARIAAGTAVAIALTHSAYLLLAARRIEPLQWVSFGLALALGGATIVTQNPRFTMVKPSLVHFGVGAAMFRRGWMVGYITPVARQNVPESALVAAGYAWAALMAALGLVNLMIALYFDLVIWAWFILIGSVGAKLAAVALQYAVFRTIVRRRLTRSVA